MTWKWGKGSSDCLPCWEERCVTEALFVQFHPVRLTGLFGLGLPEGVFPGGPLRFSLVL